MVVAQRPCGLLSVRSICCEKTSSSATRDDSPPNRVEVFSRTPTVDSIRRDDRGNPRERRTSEALADHGELNGGVLSCVSCVGIRDELRAHVGVSRDYSGSCRWERQSSLQIPRSNTNVVGTWLLDHACAKIR